MKKLVLLAAVAALGWFGWQRYSSGAWPFASRTLAASPAPAEPPNAPAAGRATVSTPVSAPAKRGQPSGDIGGVADPQGIVDRGQVTPHVEDATLKARRSMRDLEAGQGRERAAGSARNSAD
jgi:hypothetical protein